MSVSNLDLEAVDQWIREVEYKAGTNAEEAPAYAAILRKAAAVARVEVADIRLERLRRSK